MKKAFLLGVTLLATFSLTGCEMIESLLQGGQDLLNEKKDYKYDDFAVLVADKNFTFSYTKCTAEKDLAGEKTTIEYTYNSEDKLWHYQTESGNDKSEDLSIVEFLQDIKLSAALLKKSVDSIYKFSASKNGYEITANYKNESNQIDGEYTFNTEGLITLNNEKNTDLNTVKAVTKKITYKYEQSYLSKLIKSAIESIIYVGFLFAFLNSSNVVSPLKTATVSTPALIPATISV